MVAHKSWTNHRLFCSQQQERRHLQAVVLSTGRSRRELCWTGPGQGSGGALWVNLSSGIPQGGGLGPLRLSWKQALLNLKSSSNPAAEWIQDVLSEVLLKNPSTSALLILVQDQSQTGFCEVKIFFVFLAAVHLVVFPRFRLEMLAFVCGDGRLLLELASC